MHGGDRRTRRGTWGIAVGIKGTDLWEQEYNREGSAMIKASTHLINKYQLI